MKKGKLDIPTDWPRPWIDLGEGRWTILGIQILHWKKYRRPRAKFSIYGFARGYYTRIWYGKKVVHYRFKLKRVAGET
jgi:hypothetical protein